MRKLIRSKETGLFLTYEDQWTGDLREAADFKGSLLGWAKIPPGTAEYYYSFDTEGYTPYDFTIPIPPPPGTP